MHQRKAAGFTLIEVMVAIVIFAIIGQATTSLLQSAIKASEVIGAKEVQLEQLQSGMRVLQSDFTQMTLRSVREGSERLPPLRLKSVSDGLVADFVRSGWHNTNMIHKRSTLQRVTYQLIDKKLTRTFSPYLDGYESAENELRDVLILEDVTEVKFEYFFKGRWQSSWQKKNELPQGVKLTLTVDGVGDLHRVFPLAAMKEKWPSLVKPAAPVAGNNQ